MKNALRYIACMVTILAPAFAQAQLCDSITPVYTANLSGQPTGSWISPAGPRDGNCCGTTPPDKCVEFIITLDSAANGLIFTIASGAVPPGALFYQINCGPPVQVGQPVCLSGPGPHILTFCKPGNNTNSYQITSLPYPFTSGTQYASETCPATLAVTGLVPSSITWTSLPANPTYNAYLSCLAGCDSTTVTPTGAFPPYVDYVVCGYVVGGCQPVYYCDTVRVNMLNDLQVTLSPVNPVICYGSTTVSLTATVSGGLPPYLYSWSNGATTQTVTAGPGYYTLQLIDTLSCSAASDSTLVTAITVPITAQAGPNQVLCSNNGFTATLNGAITGAAGGQWTGNGGTFLPGGQSLNVTYTPSPQEITAGNTQLMLMTTGNQGCPPDTDFVSITYSQTPAPAITGTALPCAGSVGVYTTNVTGNVTVAWSAGGGTITGTAQQATVQWGAAGSGFVQLTATNGDGCDSTVTLPVTIRPQPAPVLSGTASLCGLQSGSYQVVNPDPNLSYAWLAPGATLVPGPAGTSATASWNVPGTYTVSVTATHVNGCDSTVSMNVTVLPVPAPVISGDPLPCSGSAGVYTTNLTGTLNVSWSAGGGTITSQNAQQAIVQWGAAGTGFLQLTATAVNGCDSTVTLPVTIRPQPAPVLNGPAGLCALETGTFLVMNPIPAESYTWQAPGAILVSGPGGTSATATWNVPGTYTVSVTATHINGCDSTVSVNVTVHPVPVPVINGQAVLCQYDTVMYAVQAVPGHTYFWNVSGGTLLGTPTAASILVSWPNPGTGVVAVQQTSDKGCDTAIAMTVVIHTTPTPQITGPAMVCERTTNVFSVTPVPGNYYQWDVSNGIILGSSTGPSVTIRSNATGQMQIWLLETSVYGCAAADTRLVPVNARPAGIVSGGATACYNQGQNIYSIQVAGSVSCQWQVTGGMVVSGAQSNTATIQWSSTGLLTVSVLLTDTLTGCDSTISKSVLVDSLAVPVVAADAMSGCTPLTVPFDGNVTGAGYQYYWTFGDGFVSFSPNPVHTFGQPGTYPVVLVATNSTGCRDTAYGQVVAHPVPGAAFTLWYGTSPYLIGLSELTIKNLSQGATVYRWDFGNGDFSNLKDPVYKYAVAGAYTITLSVENTWGCTDEAKHAIDVLYPEGLYVPNAFTPNGDQHNDVFYVGYDNIVQFEIRIFNRWGELLFSSSDPAFQWDGTFRGQPCVESVYQYVLRAKGIHGRTFDRTGTVTIVR